MKKRIICTRFIEHSEFFPEPSAHKLYMLNRLARGEHYDPAADGPEVDIIRRIQASHTLLDPQSTARACTRLYAETASEDIFLKTLKLEEIREALKN